MATTSTGAQFEQFNLDPALAEMVDAAEPRAILEGIVRLDDPSRIPPHFTVVSRFDRICTGRFPAAETWTIRADPNVLCLKAPTPLGVYEPDALEAHPAPARDS